MPNPLDIQITLKTEAQGVQQGAAAVQQFVAQVTNAGPAITANFTQGKQAAESIAPAVKTADAAVAAIAGTAQRAGAAMGAAGKQGQAAGEQVASGAKSAAAELQHAEEAANGFGERLKDALTFGAGNQLVSLIEEIPRKLFEVGESAVEVDAKIETAIVGLAATLRSVEPSKYLNFEAARAESVDVIDTIRAKANALGVDFHALTDAYSANLRALVEGGVTDPAKQLDLVSTLIQAAASKGITGVQALRDSIDILNGRAGNITLAKELGLESEALKQSAAQGKEYEYIMSRVGGYQEAAAATVSTLAGRLQIARNEMEQLAGAVAQPVFEALKEGLGGLNQDFVRPELASELRDVGAVAAMATKAVLDFTGATVQHAGAIKTTAELVAVLVANYALLKFGDLIVGIGSVTRAWVAQKAAAYDAAVAAAETSRLTAQLQQEAQAAALAAAQEERLAIARAEAAENARLASIHDAQELPGAAPQLYGPPVDLAPALTQAEAAVEEATASMGARFAGFFATVGEGAATLGKALYATLGPVGIGLIIAEGLTAAIGYFRDFDARAQEETQRILDHAGDLIDKFDKKTASVTTLAARDEAIRFIDANLERAKAEAAQIEAQLNSYALQANNEDSTSAINDSQKLSEEADNRLQAVKATILAGQQDREQLELVTQETLNAKNAQNAVVEATQAWNHELDQTLAKLPAIVAQFQQAAHAADVARSLALAATDAQRVGILQGEQKNSLQYINDQAKTLGYTANDATAVRNLLASVQNDPNGALAKGRPGAAEAVQNITAAYQGLYDTEQKITALQDKQTQAAKDQAAAAGKSKADYDSQVALFQARASGDKQHADALERERDISTEATRLSKEQNISYADALPLATRYVDLQNQAKDAADAEKASRKSIATDRAAARDAAKEEGEADRDRATALQKIKDDLAAVQGDPFTSDAEKIPEEIRLLNQERDQLLRNIQARQDYIDAHEGDPQFATKVGQYKSENQKDQRGVDQINQSLRLKTPEGTIEDDAKRLQSAWEFSSKNIGTAITQNIQTAVSGVSNAITGLITGTTTWRQAFAQTAESILNSLIEVGVQMGVAQLLSHVFHADARTQAAVTGASISTSMAPAAAASSVASYGTAAVAGTIAAAAAIALIIGLLVGGFAEGGLIPGTPSRSDNRIARVATGEFVVSTPAVQHYGPALFSALNDMRLTASPPAFASGGLVGGDYTPLIASGGGNGGSSSPGAGSNKVVFVDDYRKARRELLRDPDMRTTIIDTVRGSRAEVGIL